MDKKLKKIETIKFPTLFGNFFLTGYETQYPNQPNMNYALVFTTGKLSPVPAVRIHSECILSEVFQSTHCDCREQLHESLKFIHEENGILIYLNQEGRGHGIITKLHELKLQEDGMDTVDASKSLDLEVDERDYEVAIDLLKQLNVSKIKLITNNPSKINFLKSRGIDVIERVPMEIVPNPNSRKYLETKKHKLGHLLDKFTE